MIHVVIVAAGSGTRFGGGIPKQYQLLDGRPVVIRTIEAFRRVLPDSRIQLVISESMEPLWNELAAEAGFESPRTVYGGATRFESVKNALEDIREAGVEDGDIILVHDGARPLVTPAMVERVVEETRRSGAVVPVVPVTDSLRQVAADRSSRQVERSVIRAVQTPQGFDARLLLAAYHGGYRPEFTDDASVVEAYGKPVTLVDGDLRNIKITNRGDLEIAEVLLKNT